MTLENLLNKTLSEVALLTRCKTQEFVRILKKAGIKVTSLTKLEEAHLLFIQNFIEHKTRTVNKRSSHVRNSSFSTNKNYEVFIGKTIAELAESLNLTPYYVIGKIRPRVESLSASSILTQSHLRILAPQLENLKKFNQQEEKRQRAEALTVKKETKTVSVKPKRKGNKLSNYPSNETSIKIIYTGHPRS